MYQVNEWVQFNANPKIIFSHMHHLASSWHLNILPKTISQKYSSRRLKREKTSVEVAAIMWVDYTLIAASLGKELRNWTIKLIKVLYVMHSLVSGLVRDVLINSAFMRSLPQFHFLSKDDVDLQYR